MKHLLINLLSILGCIFFFGTGAFAAEKSVIVNYDTLHHPVVGRKGMVVSQNAIASQVGADILGKGGNAVDAAVAVGFALSATLPRAGNLGGGGFMLVHLADQDKTIAIDFREMAPAKAFRDMYLDEKGNVDEEKAQFSLMSSGVPGTVAGLAHALEKYGTLSWAEVLAPAIKLAEEGFVVSHDMAQKLKEHDHLRENAATCQAYFKENCIPYLHGETLKQPDLAWTLKTLKEQGKAAFYSGAIADRIVAEMQRGGGLITRADLNNYRVVEREPIKGSFRGYEVASMPPPSSGGIHVIQMLNMLDQFPLKDYGSNSAQWVHHLAGVMKRAYADRSKYLGDPDHVSVPVDGLTSEDYAKSLAQGIQDCCVVASADIGPGTLPRYESPDTTHYSVMDQWGNAVVNTYTLNFSYGSGIVIPGTGMLMNNEMDDFSAKPGSPNGYGLLGGEANAIMPTKRPLSSMTPTIVFKDGKPYLLTGSPGGSKIITAVLQILLNVMVHDMNVAEATSTPRIHHQWLPDVLNLEPGFSPDTIKLLKDMGYSINIDQTLGSTQSILWKDGIFYGAADPRRPGAGAIAN